MLVPHCLMNVCDVFAYSNSILSVALGPYAQQTVAQLNVLVEEKMVPRSMSWNSNEKQPFLVPYAARGERDPKMIKIWIKTCCNIQIGAPLLYVVGCRGCTCVH